MYARFVNKFGVMIGGKCVRIPIEEETERSHIPFPNQPLELVNYKWQI